MSPNPEPLKIRPAVVEDAESLHHLIHSVAQYFLVDPDGHGAEDFFDTISIPSMEQFLTDPDYDFQVGEVGSELAGVVAIRERRHLYNLYVAQKFHRRGFGRQLWRAALERALQSGAGNTFTVNSSPYAVRVYEDFGFVATGPRVEEMGITYIPMTMEIAALEGDS